MADLQHTLFLWTRGAFPRRVVYQLLQKGICQSVEDLHAGRTILPNFKINVTTIVWDSSGGATMEEADKSDPKPAGKSSPALRVKDKDGGVCWIHESTSIALYLEETFTEAKGLVATDILQRMQAIDMISLSNILAVDFGYYLRHAAPITSFWSYLPDEDRSLGAAKNAFGSFNRNLVKLQDWCTPTLDSTGFMTPGVDGPGIVDFAVAGNVRYFELGYDFDSFEDERLGKLREWWVRFKGTCEWWDALEEVEDVHPPQLRYAKEIREV